MLVQYPVAFELGLPRPEIGPLDLGRRTEQKLKACPELVEWVSQKGTAFDPIRLTRYEPATKTSGHESVIASEAEPSAAISIRYSPNSKLKTKDSKLIYPQYAVHCTLYDLVFPLLFPGFR